MTIEDITLEELINVREKLVTQIQSGLTKEDKEFLLSFKSMNPNWDLLELNNIENLPAVKWKLMNLKKMNKQKHSAALEKLERFLS